MDMCDSIWFTFLFWFAFFLFVCFVLGFLLLFFRDGLF